MELFGNQYRVGATDGSRDDAALNTFEFQREHRGMKPRPGREGHGFAIPDQPVSDISIEIKDADGGKGACGDLPAAPHIVDQVLGSECGRLIQRMTEDGKSRIFRHALYPSDRRVLLKTAVIPR